MGITLLQDIVLGLPQQYVAVLIGHALRRPDNRFLYPVIQYRPVGSQDHDA